MTRLVINIFPGTVFLLLISMAYAQSKPDIPQAQSVPRLNTTPARTIHQQINLTGTAGPSETINVHRNGFYAGRAEANTDGHFNIHLLLQPGKNNLTLTDANGRPYSGPASSRTVFYAPLPYSSQQQSMASRLPEEATAAPTLSLNDSMTEQNPVIVTGHADSNTTIQLFVNGRQASITQTDHDGLFHTKIPLEDGFNTIYASANQGSANTLVSNTMQLEYINPAPLNSTTGGTLTQDETWTPSGSPYIITSDLTVPTGLTLTIQSDVEVRFAASAGLQIAGTLNVQGLETAPVVFTSDNTSPSINDWAGITLQPGATSVTIDHAQIEWSFRGLYFDASDGTVSNSVIRNNQYGVFVGHDASPVIDGGNEITNNSYGLFVTGSATTVANTKPVVRANTIHSNTFRNYYARSTGTEAGQITLDATGNWWGTTDIGQIRNKIYDYSNSTSSPVVDFSTFLDAADGMPVQTGAVLNGVLDGQQSLSASNYLVLGNLNVPTGSSLDIPAGATLEFADAGLKLEVSGGLAIQGSAGSPVTLTSSQPAVAGSWQGVILNTGATAQINHLALQAATNGLYVNGSSVIVNDTTIENSSNTGIYFLNGAAGTVTHSILRNNRYGVFVSHNCSPVIDGGSEIYDNDYGIYVSTVESTLANTAPVVRDSSVHTNAFYNYYARSSGTTAGNYSLDATGNWWGSTEISTIRNKLYDQSDTSTSPVVDFSGFLDAAGGNKALSLYDVTLSAHQIHPLLNPAVNLQFVLNADATAQLDIVRESDDVVVFSTQSSLNAGMHQMSWDGKGNNAQIVNDGLYRARLSASLGAESITCDPAAPSGFGTVGIVDSFPAFMNPYRNEPFLLNLNVIEPVLISMRVTPDNGILPFTYLTDSFLPPGIQTIYWDGRDPTGQIIDGQNYIFFPTPYKTRPYVIHVTGAKPELSDPISAPSIAIKSDPYLMTHSYEQISTVTYRLDQDAIVTFKLLPPGIYDPADTNAITLVDQQLQQAEDSGGQPLDHSVEWRGYQVADTNQIMAAEEGVFTFTIEATSTASGQSTLYRGALQIRR